ncbi:MAG: putative toxin-antitoxin system toxin component, PIN family [Acidobacteria bacterium]|nr:putative toxin-antitoxin system toxin component, PIN family [Acidobacteriota bacterium]MYD69617.1 putative toxin-antitoxin system toxin component, PIN family [Acidobacteriota bacterium]MYJ03488.1 putative toxin-antitoxin system toxin component, PIN family [Acidobacteriota bacterium]
MRGSPRRPFAASPVSGHLYGRRRLQNRVVSVVFDTNVIVAALLTNGLCHECFRRAVRRRLLVSSPALLQELESTLCRKFGMTSATAAFLNTFRAQVRLADPMPLPTRVCRDEDDDVVLATAVAAGAERIVTGDDDLLVLGAYEGVRLVSPREFLEWLDGRKATH